MDFKTALDGGRIMNADIVFNLQLFAEGDFAPPADTSTDTVSDVTGGDGGDYQTAPTANEPSPNSSDGPLADNGPIVRAGGLELVIDEKTGRKLVRAVEPKQEPFADDKPTATEPQNDAQEQGNDAGLTSASITNAAQAQANVVEYTPQELTLALQLGSVDEARIPSAYLPQYNQIKAQQQFVQQQQQQQASTQATEQANQELDNQAKGSMKEFYLKIDNAAKEQAMAEAGFETEEEIEMAEYSNDPEDKEKLTVYKNALDWKKGQLMAEVQRRANERATAREQQAAIYRDIVAFTAEAKTKEPNFEAIDVLMKDHYKTLPYEQAQPIAETLKAFADGNITPEQCKVLQKYYDDARLAYYAQKNNLSTKPTSKPPVVERPGTGQTIPSKTDFRELRGLTPRERQTWMKNYFNKK